MKAFVTGGTGFIGTHLIQQLNQAGWDILVLHRPSSDLSELKKCPNCQFILGDVTDIESLRRTIPEGVDAVFHLAGSVGNLPHHKESSRYDINLKGTQNVIAVCLEKKIGRFIYTSTVATYDFKASDVVTEDLPPNDWSRDAYFHSKRLADIEVEKGLAAGLDVVFLHPSVIVGSFDKSSWSKMFIEMDRGLPLPFAPPGGGNLCHVKQVAAAHISAFHLGAKGRHFILGGPFITWVELLKDIAILLDKPAPTIVIPTPLFIMYGHIEYWISTMLGRKPTLSPHSAELLCYKFFSDQSRAIIELNYRPASVEVMLKDCYDWLLSVGMLPARPQKK